MGVAADAPGFRALGRGPVALVQDPADQDPDRHRGPEPTNSWSVLSDQHHHYTTPLCLGQKLGTMRVLQKTLDTGAGINLVRLASLPDDWERYADTLARSPRVVDASGQTLKIFASLFLFVDTGRTRVVAKFYVVPRLAVPAILGTAFMNDHVRAIYPRLQRVYWTADLAKDNPMTSILPTRKGGVPQYRYDVRPVNVHLAKAITLAAKSEVVAEASTATAGLARLIQNLRLHHYRSTVRANWLGTVKPGDYFAVRLLNMSSVPQNLKKGATIGLAKPCEGPVFMVNTAPTKVPTGESKSSVLDRLDLSDAPANMRKRVWSMLANHQSTWDAPIGTLHATEHRIEPDPATTPVHFAPSRTGMRKRELITTEMNKMLQLKVIQTIQSDSASLVAVVPKKNGKPRSCVDYRPLKAVTKKSTYPVPRMDDCLDALGEARFFSTLDCTAS